MGYDSRKAAGALVFVGGAQFMLGMLVAEALYPGYSISQNYISDLGVGPSASIFNSSVFLLGLMVLVGTYFLQRSFRNRLVTGLLVLAGVGAMVWECFPRTTQPCMRLFQMSPSSSEDSRPSQPTDC